jgi:hypothetical protein
MFNLKERHIVVVLVLIAVIFLMFLSTRTPICIREGLHTFQYSKVNKDDSNNSEIKSIFKLEKNKNTSDSIEKIEPNNILDNKNKLNKTNNFKIIDETEKQVSNPIVLSKNQIKEYGIDDPKNLEGSFNLEEETVNKIDNTDLSDVENSSIILNEDEHKIPQIDNNSKFKESYNKINIKPTSKSSTNKQEYAVNVSSQNYNLQHNNNNIHENQFNVINDKRSKVSDSNNMVDPVVDDLDNKSKVSDSNNMVDPVVDVLDNKLNEINVPDDCHECGIPVGYSNFEYNAFGLLRDEIPSVKKVRNNKPNLNDDKCYTLRSAIVNLNKGGYIDNNNVESSWNDTFKESCGNW